MRGIARGGLAGGGVARRGLAARSGVARRGMASRAVMVAAVVVAIALCALAYWAVGRSRTGGGAGVAGEPFLPALSSRADEVASIRIEQGDAVAELSRQGEGWVISSSGGYPARIEEVRGLIQGLAGLRVEEPMTALAERHGALGLAWPDSGGAARRVTVRDGTGEALADVILGTEKGAPRSQFVRQADASQTFRVRGSASPQASGAAFMDRTVVQVPADSLQRITHDGLELVRVPPAAPGSAAREGAPAAESTATAGAPVAWSTSIAGEWTPEQAEQAESTLAAFFGQVDAEDVRAAVGDADSCDPAHTIEVQSPDGTLRVLAHESDGEVWARFEVSPTGAAWEPLAARVAGWEYRLPAWKWDQVKRLRASAEPPAAPAP